MPSTMEARPTITPLPVTSGCRIDGVDLSNPLDESTEELLRTLFVQHGLLVFSDQFLDAPAHVTAIGTFGSVVDEFGAGTESLLVSNLDPDAFLPMSDALPFHSDRAYTAQPISALSLYAMEVSAGVTPTRFVDLGAAFSRLPGDLQRRVTLLSSVDMADYRVPDYPDVRPLRLRLPDDLPASSLPRQTHPTVLTHPITHRPKLFVGELTTVWIEGLSRSESNDLLETLFEIMYDDDHVYEHQWRVGDLVLWDNLAFQHGRRALNSRERRVLRRVVIAHEGFRGFFTTLGESRMTRMGPQ